MTKMTVLAEAYILPLLPLRDLVIFPGTIVPLLIERESSLKAIDAAMHASREIVCLTQKDPRLEHPRPGELHTVGTVGLIMQYSKQKEGSLKILIEGKRRSNIHDFLQEHPYYLVRLHDYLETSVDSSNGELTTIMRTVQEIFQEYANLSNYLPPEILAHLQQLQDPHKLVNAISIHLPLKPADKQSLLEIYLPHKRLEKLGELLTKEIDLLQVERKVKARIKKQLDRSERDFYLNEQLRAIQKELGEKDELKNEISELEEQLTAKKMGNDIKDKIRKELKKLTLMPSISSEATVIRNYVEWCLDLPWNEYTDDNLDLQNAEKILNADHYGLNKPKERILEYLAVQSLTNQIKGPILCLVGPPGVGKTSLARSIARAMGRNFVRQSLGGVRDEAEIRGHRRTYIGALPGKIIQSLKRAGSSNPVFLLDEIDKMSMDFRGDPASALLEVLDPEQNHAFNDHYLDLDYDLSKIMFICTANTLQGIPLPLIDRLEIIRLAGYTENEKLAIAKKYLLPKQRQENGLEQTPLHLLWSKKALQTIIELYTKEAGVRQLEREIATVYRKIVREIVPNLKAQATTSGGVLATEPVKLNSLRIKKYLGIPKFKPAVPETAGAIGSATGLAWTELGGEILQIEVMTIEHGKGNLLITGKLGEVMQESAKAAMSYARGRLTPFSLSKQPYHDLDIHIHVPEGATPKDGPSAGITMAVALVSALTKIPVRPDIAMTGEITLRGRVLGIGGLKEKALAAYKAGIRHIIIPKDNLKDLPDIPKSIRKDIYFQAVEHIDEVLKEVLAWDPVNKNSDLTLEEIFLRIFHRPSSEESLVKSPELAEEHREPRVRPLLSNEIFAKTQP